MVVAPPGGMVKVVSVTVVGFMEVCAAQLLVGGVSVWVSVCVSVWVWVTVVTPPPTPPPPTVWVTSMTDVRTAVDRTISVMYMTHAPDVGVRPSGGVVLSAGGGVVMAIVVREVGVELGVLDGGFGASLTTKPEPHTPYCAWHPLPQWSSDWPHQPFGEQQLP
jgi:hypothetical protein